MDEILQNVSSGNADIGILPQTCSDKNLLCIPYLKEQLYVCIPGSYTHLPTIGLHPLDVQTLLKVFDRLVSKGATVIVIEHDLDVIRNADYIIDMGPGGGEAGGRIIAKGTPEEIASDRGSITGKYLR